MLGRTLLFCHKKLLLCEIIAQKFPLNLSEITQERGCCARINFPVSETEQFWRKIPSQLYKNKLEKSMVAYKIKDRFTYYLFTLFKHC